MGAPHRALRFEPVGMQAGLQAIDITGNSEYRIDPRQEDFYERLIDLRTAVKEELKVAKGVGDAKREAELDAEQLALKICANATSYGIFVELNVEEQSKPQGVTCYGYGGKGFPTEDVRNLEKPGRYFHPLLATLITGGARLMLAMAERLATDAGITWAFCDTDSMALAKPDGMEEADFVSRANGVRDWFTPLNPYEHKGELFKVEDANKGVKQGQPTDGLEPLYCFAVSAKRYALFNIDKRRRPVMRKVSAHGLGHLRPPHSEEQASKKIPNPIVSLQDLSGVERWQHDLWYRIVQSARGDAPEQVKLDDLPSFHQPAVSRYAATTPRLLRWFKGHNRGKPYHEQVRPFGFMLAFHSGSVTANRTALKPVSAYDKDPRKAAAGCFDRETGEPVTEDRLLSYREALAQYHLHPEAKFHGGDYTDRGVTSRRHVIASTVEHIGKEANRWEEQFYVGLDLEAQTEYGIAPEDTERILGCLRVACERLGQRAVAKMVGMSLRDISTIVQSKSKPTAGMLRKLSRAVPRLEAAYREQATYRQEVLDAVREHCQNASVRQLANRGPVIIQAALRKDLSPTRKSCSCSCR
jgi:hypothetical protein